MNAQVTFVPFPDEQRFGVYKRRLVEVMNEPNETEFEIRDVESGIGDTVPRSAVKLDAAS